MIIYNDNLVTHHFTISGSTRTKVSVNMHSKKLIKEKLPKHIAIIMDGNGRWAKNHALKRIMGHQKGMDAVREVVRECNELGIRVLTLYAFSTENWRRPKLEIKALMSLLKRYIRSEIDKLHKNNIQVKAIGDLEKLPKDVFRLITDGAEKTKNNSGMVLNVALSYSGRDVSNFLLWQIAYTEIYVTDALWPDFRKDDLFKALADYQKRKRRFGFTDEQINSD
jgi:undecaprenyl diphosphate synthase